MKIVKTSSDGKLEGFSFRVTGPNGYEEVFVTDANGEILINGLRVGDYNVSEVENSASSAYVLPEGKTVHIYEGTVITVTMHKELRDTPKTGDDTNPGLWLALMIVSVTGGAICGGLYFVDKKKKQKGETSHEA